MKKDFKTEYIKILKAELVPAMGCTEPISLAFGAAYCRKLLGELPIKVTALCSGNIIKNVRCVKIPHSGGMVGIEEAVLLGAVGGDSDREMEVLTSVTNEDIGTVNALLDRGVCTVKLLDSPAPLHFILRMEGLHGEAEVEICEDHTNIVRAAKNGMTVIHKDYQLTDNGPDYSTLNLEDIKAFADTVDIELVKPIIDPQIECNIRIAHAGMDGSYGIGIGKIITATYPDSPITEMKSMAASASEARMGGCELPVIVNSGSGNQGITASVPVIVYAKRKGLSAETLYRGLVFSNLLTVFQKMYIGKLSAFCGVVSAGCGAGAAITYMVDGSVERIKQTIENTLANVPGIICDGAKISCAAKISTSIDAAYLAHEMAMRDAAYNPHTGILQATTAKTISCVGKVGKDGMRETDKEILKILLEDEKRYSAKT